MTVHRGLVLIELGTIVYDRPDFHNERYIFPVGFISEKLYYSPIDPSEKVWWRSYVLDDGSTCPLFRVELKDDPTFHWEARICSSPWGAIRQAVIVRAIELGINTLCHTPNPTKYVPVSGPDKFGFSHPTVLHLIQNMDNAGMCTKYVRRHFEIVHKDGES
jgi:chromodomain-helicase-DNA-binding protein 7